MPHTNGNHGSKRRPISEPQQLFINGEYTSGQSNDTFPVKNPMTGKTLYQCASATIEDYDIAIKGAHAAYRSWSQMGPSARRLIMLKAADLMLSYLDEDAPELLSSEVSATSSWVKANMISGSSNFREAAALTTHIKGEVVPSDRPGTTVMITREPLGVILTICPWNMPGPITARAICYALICGNAVVLKPSENSPKSQHLVVRALIEGGLPAGCLQYLPTSAALAPSVIEFAIRHPLLSKVNFTGSERVGKIIASIAAQYLKPCVLELGGKAPALVLKDADIDNAVRSITLGAFKNSGQICMSTERVIVHQSIAKEFKDKLITYVESLTVGNHLEDPGVQISGMFTPESAKRVLGMIQAAIDGGAKLLTGDLQLHGPTGSILGPYVLEGVTRDMDLYYKESFGPVLFINEFDTEENGIALTNDTDFTLCGAIFSRDVLAAKEISKQMKCGSCHINGPTIFLESTLPHGGIGGSSGHGRFGGTAGIEAFTNRHVVSMVRPGLEYIF